MSDHYCEFEEATKAEDAANFWDAINGQRYGITLFVANKLLEQEPYNTIDYLWEQAEEICVREDAYKDINKQIDEYYSE